MKQTLTIIACFIAAISFAACKGNSTNGTSGEGGDSTKTTVQADSTITEEEGIVDELPIDENSLPYAFLYCEKGEGKVYYWSQIEPTEYDKPDKEQMLIRQHKDEYNVAVRSDFILDVTYKEEIVPTHDEEDWTRENTIGMIGATITEAGLVYRFTKPQVAKRAMGDWEQGFFVLTSKENLNEHPLVHYEYIEGVNDYEYRSLPSNVVKQMEQKYGLKCTRSSMVASIGEDITYGVMQFEPKGEHVLGLEVLVQKGNIYTAESKGYYDAGTGEFGWNVDDEGEYYSSNIVAVVENGNFPIIFTTRGAPESLTTGWMTVKDGKILRHIQEMYYIYYN